MSENPLLVEVKNLKVQFDVRDGIIQAVDGATFNIVRGRTLGVIGESGCGKSVTARAILRMVPKPGKVAGGEILYHRRVGSRSTIWTPMGRRSARSVAARSA